jgi:RHS repeat-associated protein
VQFADAQIAPPAAFSSAATINYVRSWEALAPEQSSSNLITRPFTDVHQTTQYFDGLGRLVQTVHKQTSPLQNDMVTANIYDALGREQYQYLPFAANTRANSADNINDGNFKLDPIQQQVAFYNNQLSGQTGETYVGTSGLNWAYSQTAYEASPLNRIQNTYAPGTSWIGSNRGITVQHQMNTAAENIRIWTIGAVWGSIPVSTANYADGLLYKTVTIDERGKQVIEYKDMQGKVILKKVQLSDTPGIDHTGWLNTYYVYDDFNLLRFVITPRAVELINNNWLISTSIADQLCFRYEYDQRHRMVIKKVPGAGETWMVYDGLGRLVMMQDANLRNAQKWLYTQYDYLNRPIATGLMYDPANYNNFNYHLTNAYNTNSYPNLTAYSTELLTQTFYDNYNWVNANGSPLPATMDASNTTNSNYFITAYNTTPTYAQPIIAYANTTGLPTGTMVKVMGSNPAQYIWTVTFYDDHNRVIQTQTKNYTGGIDISTNQYDFSGKILRNLLQHNKAGNNAQSHTVLSKYSYDQAGRLLTITKTINSTVTGVAVSSPEKTIVSNQYDELGQLKAKTLGSGIESLTYDYNIRGWLLGINRNYISGSSTNKFGMELAYDKTNSVAGTTYANAQYNGNITGTVWKSAGDATNRKYDFTYDNVNRITAANFLQNSNSNSWDNAFLNFSVNNLSYDANGNILTMNQYGYLIGSSGLIDQLNYTYQNNGSSNQLQQVTDAANNPSSTLGDFHYNTATKTTTDYAYDANGNLISDQNKAISSIQYNYLNLPQQVSVTAKGNIQYVYDASGNKLAKITTDNTLNPAVTNATLYINGFVYQNDVLQFVSHEEGRARFIPAVGSVPASFAMDYFIKDHLGNVRMVLTDEQKQDIYPAATVEGSITSNTSAAYIENQYYSINPAAIVPNPRFMPTYANNNGIPNNNPNSNTTANSTQVYKLNSSTGDKSGLGITLKVMAGDVIDIFGKSYYSQNNTNDNSNYNLPILTLLSGLLGTPANPMAAATHGAITGSQLSSIGNNSSGVGSFLTSGRLPTTSTVPRAYINYIILNDQFQYISGGFSVVGSSGVVKDHHSDASMQGIQIPKNGYIYIYCSNESPVDVFFDNVQVVHTRGPLLEETHYYPFGLTMAGISSQALNFGQPENKYKFNKGSELQSKEFSDGSGLEWYATNFRSLDPQLGRWWQIDPKATESESPYASMSNNPIRFNDPLGDTIIDAQIKADKNWGKAYNTFLNSKAGKRFVKLYSPGGKYGTTKVIFKVGKTNQDNSAQGNTKTFSVNRKDGSSTELIADKRYAGINKVASGQSKDSYLKFEVTLREGDDMNNSTEQVEGGEAILHETQHVRADQQTLITDKAIISPYLIHRDFMKPVTSEAYEERYSFYIENKQLWQADYNRQKSQGKVTSKSDYINKKINDFRNY